jgi:RNA polymerase sigma-70 factor (ECF subfamily)
MIPVCGATAEKSSNHHSILRANFAGRNRALGIPNAQEDACAQELAPNTVVVPALAVTVDEDRLNNEETAPIEPSDFDSNHLRDEVEQWFLELREPMFRYLRAAGCRFSVAEEITQESFLRLHYALRAGLRVTHVRAWVFRVARNLAIDTQREQQKHWRTRQPEDLLDVTCSDSAPNPEQQVLARERMRLIESEVLRLPSLQRECVRLKAQGLRYQEIAEALDISSSAAVDSVRGAVRRLATRIRFKA